MLGHIMISLYTLRKRRLRDAPTPDSILGIKFPSLIPFMMKKRRKKNNSEMDRVFTVNIMNCINLRSKKLPIQFSVILTNLQINEYSDEE